VNAVSEYVSNILSTATSFYEGLSVTMSWMFRRPMTIQYPDKIEKPIEETLPERYRGILENDIRYCIGCQACMRACPIECILMDVSKHPESGDRMLTRFDIDVSKCMFCGLCTEVCPTGCLHHTPLFEGTASHIENLILRFVDTPVLPFKLKKGEEYPIDRSGRIAQSLIKNYFAPRPEEFSKPRQGDAPV
jgi:NADH-quinone oxidoreductase subunit I/NAD(P)H-quinone oxidoreductase subunit I